MYILNSVVCMAIGSLCGFIAGQYYVYRVIKKNHPWFLDALEGVEVCIYYTEDEGEESEDENNG